MLSASSHVPTLYLGEYVEISDALKPQTRTVAETPAETDVFSAEEMAIVDDVIDRYWNYTGTDMSDLAHKASLGWQAARLKEDIPYETVHVSSREPSATVLEIVKQRMAAS